MIKISVEKITPEIARKWLDTSLGNPRYGRSAKVNERTVNQYASDMTLGRWELSNASIGFDKNGHLIDGHTRLNAVIKSGKTIESIVVRGLEQTVERVVDTHTPRTLLQRMLCAYGYDSDIANRGALSAARQMLAAREGQSYVEKIPDSVLIDFINDHCEMLAMAYTMCAAEGTKFKLAKTGAFISSMCEALEYGVKPELIESFIRIVNTGRYEIEEQTAALVLREFLLTAKVSKNTRKNAVREAEAIQTLLQKYIKAEPCKKLPTARSLVYTKLNIARENGEDAGNQS